MKKLTAFSKWSKTVWTYLAQYAIPKNKAGIKTYSLSFAGAFLLTLLLSTAGIAQNITLTTAPLAAANIMQGTNNNIVYIVRMDVAVLPVTINNMQFTLTGTHDNNDMTTLNLFFNDAAPSLTGATQIEINGSGLFAAPHAYALPFNLIGTKTMAAGSSGYFIVTVNTDPAATNGHTIKVDGLANPVSFSYSTVPVITNNQTDIAGEQTIQAAAVTLSSSPVAAGIIAQGINNNVVYIVKMDVASMPVTINSMHFTLTGTHDNNDLPIINLYFNATAPSLTGATIIEINGDGFFAAPHDYNLPFNMIGTKTMAAGSSGYFIITVNIDPAANNGHTIKVDGLAHPASFGYTTAPSITNNQTDVAGEQTIQGAGVTLSSSPVPAGIIAQGINNNVVYIVKMDVALQPVTINSMHFTLTGTHDNNDLPILNLYFNATAPSLTGATIIEINGDGFFAAPHDYNLPFNMIGTKTMAAGSSGYFIVTVNTDLMATGGNTIKVDGLAHPASFGYSTAPTITNNQTDVAGVQTIQAAGITLTSSPIAPGIIAQGSNNNIVYIVKMDVASQPVTVSNMQFTLNGTHDNNDLTIVNIFFNDAAPSLTGASLIELNGSALFAAPHDYNLSFNVIVSKLMAAGSSGYFIVTVNTDAAATGGNTVKVDGLAHPASFGYSTAPTITNNQADLAGNQSIGFILPLNLLSFNAMEQQNGAVQLQWVTANELNTKHFEVAWSNDGVNFAKIAQLSAAGNSQQNKRYSYLHTKPVDGNNYYRLTMMDIDGHFTYSPVIKINRAVTITQITVFPNPVVDHLQLQVQAVKDEDILLQLYSTDGKLQTSKSFSVKQGNNQLSWNLAQLAAGNYFISAGGNRLETIRIIKN